MALDWSPESFSPQNEFYLLLFLLFQFVIPGAGPVLNPGPSYKKRDKGPLLDAT